ncbi:unnamed protein product [Gulo gulo]|uniref:Uncharacterized protein n=1 Tax=Gulo gulo TaxID=48420 RepID=A0A9X9Q0D3_GULGU|nr:unnamed protein product [Gulo gulo]
MTVQDLSDGCDWLTLASREATTTVLFQREVAGICSSHGTHRLASPSLEIPLSVEAAPVLCLAPGTLEKLDEHGFWIYSVASLLGRDA